MGNALSSSIIDGGLLAFSTTFEAGALKNDTCCCGNALVVGGATSAIVIVDSGNRVGENSGMVKDGCFGISIGQQTSFEQKLP